MKKRITTKKSGTRWDRLNRKKDSEIDTSDIPPLDEDFWKHAELWIPGEKQMVSIRLDKDVLNWFKKQGKGYQTKINEVLRTYMRAKAA